ncbi:MAG: transcription antitermination factor NusB [Kiritimatiellae bacterium]|nr:transcription antitermination factor NusB [Kiritimatiellia bacterium]
MTSSSGTRSRTHAIRIMADWLDRGDFPDRLLPDVAADHGFIMDLVFGAVRGRRRLEWVLTPFVKRRPTAVGRAALLLGAQQLLFMPDVAEHAAVHATVEAVKALSPGNAGFVNAVLRNVLRRREALLADLERQPLAVRESHPDLLIRRWTARLGAEETEALCRWNNEPAETIVTVLPGGDLPAAELLRRWQDAGVAARAHPACAEALILPHGARVESLEGYDTGAFVPQDPATLEAVRLLDAQPGMRVLDACAAPGGKTAQLAARMQRRGELIALDLHEDRLPRLRANLQRLGLDRWVQVEQADAGEGTMARWGRFDRVLLDAPCSNTGVLRRRPDARWRFTEPRLQALANQQRRLLSNLLPLLSESGRLVYSTCSLEPEENGELVESVCAAATGFRLVATGERRPARDGTDGAFAAAIERDVRQD